MVRAPKVIFGLKNNNNVVEVVFVKDRTRKDIITEHMFYVKD